MIPFTNFTYQSTSNTNLQKIRNNLLTPCDVVQARHSSKLLHFAFYKYYSRRSILTPFSHEYRVFAWNIFIASLAVIRSLASLLINTLAIYFIDEG